MTHIFAPTLYTDDEERANMPENMDIIMIMRNTANVIPTKRAINLLLSLTRSFNAILRIPDTAFHLLSLFANNIRLPKKITYAAYYKFTKDIKQALCMLCFPMMLPNCMGLTIISFFSCARTSTFFPGNQLPRNRATGYELNFYLFVHEAKLREICPIEVQKIFTTAGVDENQQYQEILKSRLNCIFHTINRLSDHIILQAINIVRTSKKSFPVNASAVTPQLKKRETAEHNGL